MADFSEGEDDSIYNVELEQYEGDQDLIIASKDFEKVANSCIKRGYVEGVEAGKDEGLKEGFSSGFSSGIMTSTPWAILKGQINALMVYRKAQEGGASGKTTPTAITELQELLRTVETTEEKWKQTQTLSDRESYEDVTKKVATLGDNLDTDAAEGAVAMETEGANDEGVRSGGGVSYGEVVDNIHTPSVVGSLRQRALSLAATCTSTDVSSRT